MLVAQKPSSLLERLRYYWNLERAQCAVWKMCPLLMLDQFQTFLTRVKRYGGSLELELSNAMTRDQFQTFLTRVKRFGGSGIGAFQCYDKVVVHDIKVHVGRGLTLLHGVECCQISTSTLL